MDIEINKCQFPQWNYGMSKKSCPFYFVRILWKWHKIFCPFYMVGLNRIVCGLRILECQAIVIKGPECSILLQGSEQRPFLGGRNSRWVFRLRGGGVLGALDPGPRSPMFENIIGGKGEKSREKKEKRLEKKRKNMFPPPQAWFLNTRYIFSNWETGLHRAAKTLFLYQKWLVVYARYVDHILSSYIGAVFFIFIRCKAGNACLSWCIAPPIDNSCRLALGSLSLPSTCA